MPVTVYAGFELTPEVSVENTGSNFASQDVTLTVGGEQAAPAEQFALDAGQIETTTLSSTDALDIDGFAPKLVDMVASSESTCVECSAEITLDIQAPMQLSNPSVPNQVFPGEAFNGSFTVEVTNAGYKQTRTVEIALFLVDVGQSSSVVVGDSAITTQTVSVGAGSTETVEINPTIPPINAGFDNPVDADYEVRFQTEYSRVTAGTEVLSPLFVDVFSLPASVEAGTSVQISSEIANSTQQQVTSDVTLYTAESATEGAARTEVATKTVDVPNGGTTIDFDWTPSTATSKTQVLLVELEKGDSAFESTYIETDSQQGSFEPRVSFAVGTATISYESQRDPSQDPADGSVDILAVPEFSVIATESYTLEPGQTKDVGFVYGDPTPGNESGEIVADVNGTTSGDTSPTLNVSLNVAYFSTHSHLPKPGIIDEFGAGGEEFYPRVTDVLVGENGEDNLTSILSSERVIPEPPDGQSPDSSVTSEWTETIDLTGKLTEGAFNVIEVRTNSLGNLQVFVEGDVYRQIRGEG